MFYKAALNALMRANVKALFGENNAFINRIALIIDWLYSVVHTAFDNYYLKLCI